MSMFSSFAANLTGNKTGPPNPFSTPDLSFLLDPKRYGDPNNPLGGADQYYQDLMKKLAVPSSIDEVTSGVNSDMMKNLLTGIDTDTTKAIGDNTASFADRGLAGPGQLSDIEANAAGDIRSKALLSKDNARLGFASSELQAQKDREDQLYQTMGQRASAGTSLLSGLRGLNAAGSNAYATDYSNLYNAAADRNLKGKAKSWFGMVGDNFGKSFGETAGKDAAGGSSDLIKALLMAG